MRIEVAELDSTLSFLRSLWELEHALQARSKVMISRLGITGPQRFALRLIGMRDQVASGELSRLMHLHPSTLTGLLKRLDERGFVVRRSDPSDARRVMVSLTQLGRRATQDTPVCIEAAARRVLKRFNRRQLGEAQELLGALAVELHDGPSGLTVPQRGRRRRIG